MWWRLGVVGALMLAVAGCTTLSYDQGRVVPEMVRSPWGTDEPLICYVKARHFKGLVPEPCSEAEIAQ